MLHHLYKDHLPPLSFHNNNNRLSLTITTAPSASLSAFLCKMAHCILFIVFALFLQGAFGELVCEELPVGMCSFSVASSAKRCLLETSESVDGNQGFQCKTSEVVATTVKEYIENDGCVSACGVDRKTFGISSDSLLETQFTLKLCSPQCYYNCPNIIDLYHNLALAEGILLSEMCESQSTRSSVIQVQSSGAAASGPSAASGPAAAYAPMSSSTPSVACAPAPSESCASFS